MPAPLTGTFYIKRGDTADALVYQATRFDPSTRTYSPISVQDAEVVFKMRRAPNDTSGLVINKDARVLLPTDPLIPAAASDLDSWLAYEWDSQVPVGDTALPGTYIAEFEVTFSTGRIETYPTTSTVNAEYITVVVVPDLDDLAAAEGDNVPGAPLGVTAVAGDSQAVVSFSPPTDNGGAAVTSYNITATDLTTAANGGQLAVVTSSPGTVTGLTNNDDYTFKVAAVNSVGAGAQSIASGTVTPTAPATIPSQPIGPSAIGGNGQATITFSAPANTGGAAITNYIVTAVDTTTQAHGGQTSSGTALSQTISGLTNSETYYFYVKAVNSVGTSQQSVATNTVVPATPGTGTPLATFSYTQETSSTLDLDATGSNGTRTWYCDGTAATDHSLTLRIGPLILGQHVIRLDTVVGGGTATTSQTIDVAWIAKPLYQAQKDLANGIPTAGIDLPKLGTAIIQPIGPWRNAVILNETDSVPPGDGIERLTIIDDNHISLLTKYGDWTSTTGGYRSSFEWNNAYDADLAGLPLATTKNIDVCGMGTGTGHTGSVRFYRVEVLIPAANPNPWLYQNNVFEVHGNAGGGAPLRFATNGQGTNLRWVCEPLQNGSSGGQKVFDDRAIVRDAWYNYVVEMLFDLDPAIGYVRVWKEGVAVTGSKAPAGTLSDGRFFCATQQTDVNGNIILQAFQIENYRTRGSMPPDYPDAVVHYRNIRVGPTMASVTI